MFYWLNRFNEIEEGGPFESEQEAKDNAAAVYTAVQNGFAYDILIGSTDAADKPRAYVSNGYVKDGKWVDGSFFGS